MLEEGIRYSIYKDTMGIDTIGVGHNCMSSPLPQYMQEYYAKNGKLTLAHIMELLEKDIDKAEQGCRKLYDNFNDFTENRKVALVDLCFNLGSGSLAKFLTSNAAIRSGNWEAAGAGFKNSKWAKQVGEKRSNGIIELIVHG